MRRMRLRRHSRAMSDPAQTDDTARFTGLVQSRSKMTPYKEGHGEDAARAAIIAVAHRFADAEGRIGMRFGAPAAVCGVGWI